MTWQLIETHPRSEKEPFLVYAPWGNPQTTAVNVFKVWWDTASEEFTGFTDGGNNPPTHWMPMPPPPKLN